MRTASRPSSSCASRWSATRRCWASRTPASRRSCAASPTPRPKVADYPFTTLAPQLGTVELDGQRQLTVADVPGLLEGASDGVGLGHAFLAHLERATHSCTWSRIDPEAGDPLADCRRRYAAIYGELAKHGGGLADRPQIVVLNKLDLIDDAEGAALVQAFADAVAQGGLPPDAVVARDEHATPYVLGLSCATGAGVASLRGALERVLGERCARAEPAGSGEDELADYLLYRPRARQRIFRLVRDDGTCASRAARSSRSSTSSTSRRPRACARSRSSSAASA